MPIDEADGWELVWNDEFDGDAIDGSNWTYDLGGWGWGNGEAQNYTSRPENARVENGLLVIELRQEKYRGFLLHVGAAQVAGACVSSSTVASRPV